MFRRAALAWSATGVILLLAACGASPGASDSSNGGSSSTPLASIAPSPTRASTPQPTTPLDDVGWEMAGGGPLPRAATPIQVAVSGSTIVTIGPNADPSGSPTASWSSTNGEAWTRGTVAGKAGGWLRDVVAFPDGFVAVGDDGCPFGVPFALEGCTPVIWRSADGSTWSRVSLTEPADARLTAVTTWHNELVAVGGLLTDPDTEASTPLILRSSDGIAWEILAPAAGTAGFLTDIAADGAQLVAVGVDDTNVPGPSTAVAWTSSDSDAWIREVIGETGLVQVMVAPMPGGFVATCQGPHTSNSKEPMGWTRGAAWTALPMPDVPLDSVTGVAGGPQGAVIVGTDNMIDFGTRPPLLYATHDGTGWGFVPPLGAASTGGFFPDGVSWQDGCFWLPGVVMSTGARMVLVGMAYVPQADEIPYSPPSPSVTLRPAASEPGA